MSRHNTSPPSKKAGLEPEDSRRPRRPRSKCAIYNCEFSGDKLRKICKNGHYMHHGCIRQWGQVNPTCPLCREPILGINPPVVSPEQTDAYKVDSIKEDPASYDKKPITLEIEDDPTKKINGLFQTKPSTKCVKTGFYYGLAFLVVAALLGFGIVALTIPNHFQKSYPCTYIGASDCDANCAKRLGCGNDQGKLWFEYKNPYDPSETLKSFLYYREHAQACCAHVCCEGPLKENGQYYCDLEPENPGIILNWHDSHPQTVMGGWLVAIGVAIGLITICVGINHHKQNKRFNSPA